MRWGRRTSGPALAMAVITLAGCDERMSGPRELAPEPAPARPQRVPSAGAASTLAATPASAVSSSSASSSSSVAATREMSLQDAPSPRSGARALWTGRLLVVWGGDDAVPSERTGYAPVPPHALRTGGRYDLALDRWQPTSLNGAPRARQGHSMTWTGREVLVWGGSDGRRVMAAGGRYDPAADAWSPMSSAREPSARDGHTALWTGSALLVWGGSAGRRILGDGGRYDPATDTWRPISARGAPSARREHTAVWTGSRMLVWGGLAAGGARADGGLYDPATDTWSPLSDAGAPSARSGHTAVWAADEMIVWGGVADQRLLASGGRWRSREGAWLPMSAGAVPARARPQAFWNGREVWLVGTYDDDSDAPDRCTEIYVPATDAWRRGPAVAVFANVAAASTGHEILLWGGFYGENDANDGYVVRP